MFDEPHKRIAEIIGTSEQNARQLVTRGRRHVEERRPRFEASREQHEQLAARFFAAAEEGDLEALEELLAHDVVLHGDGGGKAPAIARAIHGRARVARTLIGGLRTATRAGGFTLRRQEINGQPGGWDLWCGRGVVVMGGWSVGGCICIRMWVVIGCGGAGGGAPGGGAGGRGWRDAVACDAGAGG